MVTINYETIQFIKRPRTLILIILLIVSIASIGIFGLQEGLDLQGGSMINLHLDQPVDQDTMSTVTAVLDKRLNAFGISDVKVRQSGSQDVIVEIAGVKPEEVEKIVSTPGKFEAKINGNTAISGSDIASVSAAEVTGNRWQVPFSITTSGAEHFAKVAEGQAGAKVEMYLDDELISDPQLDAGLANGKASTEVSVSGGEESKQAAQDKANEIHTVLESGALPVKLSINGVSSVSAELGSQFETGAIIAGILALLAIAAVVTIKYRSPSLIIPIVVTSISELLLVLGFASIIHWNLDLAAIAGIIAAMLPLAYIGFARGATGIGMLTGFAVTTVVGVLVGIFITRPVFADYMETFLIQSPSNKMQNIKKGDIKVKDKKKGRKTIAREQAEAEKKNKRGFRR